MCIHNSAVSRSKKEKKNLCSSDSPSPQPGQCSPFVIPLAAIVLQKFAPFGFTATWLLPLFHSYCNLELPVSRHFVFMQIGQFNPDSNNTCNCNRNPRNTRSNKKRNESLRAPFGWHQLHRNFKHNFTTSSIWHTMKFQRSKRGLYQLDSEDRRLYPLITI